MKKFMLGALLCFLGLLITILLLSRNRKILEKEFFYTIPHIYTYMEEENKEMCFTIYTNSSQSFISFADKNTYTLHWQKNSYQLKDIRVEKNMNCSIEGELYYSYKIFTPLLNFSASNILLEDCQLEIRNEHYTLECLIGEISIYKECPSVDFTDLYGNYAYYDQELHLVGFTIALAASYKKLEMVSIGNAFCPLSFIEKDVLYDSERQVSSFPYPLISKNENYTPFVLSAKNDYYYIPIAYKDLKFIQEACILMKIDGTFYHIPNFIFLANDIFLVNYPNKKVAGVCKECLD